MKEDEYRIIHLKEPSEMQDFSNDHCNFYKALPELKGNNVLKRITLSFSYFSDINSAYLKEDTIYKDISVKMNFILILFLRKIFDGLELCYLDIKDEYANAELICGDSQFDIISLTDFFYLSVSLENYCEDNYRFQLIFHSPAEKKNLAQIEVNEKRNIKRIFKFTKFHEEETTISCWNDLLQISWESLDMKAQGALEIKEEFKHFRNKIFISPVLIFLNLNYLFGV